MALQSGQNQDESEAASTIQSEPEPIFKEDFVTPQELAVKAKTRKQGPDPYIAVGTYSEQQADRILRKAKSLRDGERECFDRFIKEYQDRLFEHCRKNELGLYAEGGCEQTAYQYSLHTRVIEKAINHCVKK